MGRPRAGDGIAVAGLAASALALAVAPRSMPTSYSWVAHTTSESAAQGVPGAWLARAGFGSFGVAVLLIASHARGRWGRWGTGLHVAFGASMVGAAVFSARPWDERLPYSTLEDVLHSVAATAMGFAFALGVIVVARRRWRTERTWRTVDVSAVTASVVLPLAMVGAAGYAGLLQRAMFLIAYLWYGLEATRPAGPAECGGPSVPPP